MKYGAEIIEDVPGCYLLADAVAGLLDRRYWKSAFPLPATTFLAMLVVAVVGCLLPLKLAAFKTLDLVHSRQCLWATLIALSASCSLGVVLASSYWAVHLAMAGFCLLTPMAVSFWVELTRNRHRILDRNRRTSMNLNPATDGTITLASKRSTSLRGTG